MGKERERGADRCGGRREVERGGGGESDRRGGSGLCVVCEDLCPSVRGSVCTSSSVYLPSSWVSHFSPLTHSHLSPRVNIYTLRNAQSFSMHGDVQTVYCTHCTVCVSAHMAQYVCVCIVIITVCADEAELCKT